MVKARKEEGLPRLASDRRAHRRGLRLYARMHVGEPANYWKDAHVEEIVASASDHDRSAAFHAAVKQYPQNRPTLRQGTRAILRYPD